MGQYDAFGYSGGSRSVHNYSGVIFGRSPDLEIVGRSFAQMNDFLKCVNIHIIFVSGTICRINLIF